MKSKFLSINWKDTLRGIGMAVLTGAFTALYGALSSGTIDKAAWKSVGIAAAAGGVGYIVKNFFTNSQDQVLKPEPEAKP